MRLRTLVFAFAVAISPVLPDTAHADVYEDETSEDDGGWGDFFEVIGNLENAGWTSVGPLGDGLVMSQDLGPVIQYVSVTPSPGGPAEIVYLGTFPKP